MKKVLFATTALIATAGIASAELTIKGSAEMGIAGGDRYGNDDAKFFQDFDIKVDGTGSTDNGLTFGYHIEIEDTNSSFNTNGSAAFDNEAVFISGAFGKLTLGETDGAFDWAMTEVALAGGSIADDETSHAGYNGNSAHDGIFDNQILRYEYSFGDFGMAVSAELDDAANPTSTDVFGIGFKYSADLGGVGLDLGLAFQSGSGAKASTTTTTIVSLAPFVTSTTTTTTYVDVDAVGFSAKADFGNGFMAAVNYSDYDVDAAGADFSHYAIGVAYEMDALTLAANYGNYDFDTGPDADGYGLIANYDLGGGATIQFGYGSGEGVESYSFGIAMSF